MEWTPTSVRCRPRGGCAGEFVTTCFQRQSRCCSRRRVVDSRSLLLVLVVALAAGGCASAEDTRAVMSAAPASSEGTGRTPGALPTSSGSVAPTSTSGSSMSSTSSTSSTSTTTTTVPVPTTTPYRVPLERAESAGWGTTHSGYQATDIFAGCGAVIVSPVNGVLLEVRTIDGWDPAIDNPATRGGRSISILGDDGVRYYMAHFEEVEAALAPGDRVALGDRLGTVGRTGRASACHIHFALSPTCPGKEWSVRRGVIWPYPYLDAWKRGEVLSPVEEIRSWLAVNPDGCAIAMADPNALDA